MEMTKFLSLILVISSLPGYSLVNVKQPERLLLVQSGKPVVLNCDQDESNYFYMYWYKHIAEKEMKLMVLSIEVKSEDMEADFKDRWYLKRPSVFNSSLHLKESNKTDSATYFCAASMGGPNTAAYFGAGTILSVLGNNTEQLPPKVKIFPPNKQELKDHDLISLVCVASGFYPEHVWLRWSVNDKTRNDLYKNVASFNNISNTFYTSKRLTLTRSEYFNTENTFKCEAGFIGNSSDDSQEIRGESDCGVSKETYAMYINQGKISYIMVLFKSGLYALIVLAIIWRRKVLSGSC